MKRHYSYLLSDHRSGGLKHCSLDRNIKQSFQAGTVGSQLQLIVLKTRNTTWTSLFCAILLLYLINLKWNMKWNKTVHMNWVPTLMEAAHVSAFFCTSSTFSFFPLISVWSACAVSKKKSVNGGYISNSKLNHFSLNIAIDYNMLMYTRKGVPSVGWGGPLESGYHWS